MASTGVPPTGRSRAFANRFSGFHRAKTLIGGSLLTGVSVATGARRSRTRIDPCFRAARTHAPVRRCSSLIEISFMCHIVTHRWATGKPWPHASRNVRRSPRTRRKALGIDAQASRDWDRAPARCTTYSTRQPDRSKRKGSRWPAIEPNIRILAHRDAMKGPPGSLFFVGAIAAHFPAHRECADRVLTVSPQENLVSAGVSSNRYRTERPPPCRREIAAEGTADFTYTYEVR